MNFTFSENYFSIKEKSFQSLDKKISLKKLNIISGRNNSGKTNLVNYLLKSLSENKLSNYNFTWFGLKNTNDRDINYNPKYAQEHSEDKNKYLNGHSILHTLYRDKKLRRDVSKTLSEILGSDIYVDVILNKKNHLQISYNDENRQVVKTIDDGSLQLILVVFFIIYFSEYYKSQEHEEIILVLHEPELHFHPYAQERMADEFIKLLHSKLHPNLVIETHSENFIKRVEQRIKENELKPSDFQILFCEMKKEGLDKYTSIHKIEFESNKSFFLQLPSGFLSTDYENMIRILENQKKELEAKNNELENMNSIMQKMINKYAHTMANHLFPNLLYRISEKIKKSEYLLESIQLKNAYHSELNLKWQGELLRAQFGSFSGREKFRNMLKNDRVVDDDNSLSIIDVINISLDRLIERIFNNPNRPEYSDFINNVTSRNKKNPEETLKDYHSIVYFSEKEDSLTWFDKHCNNIRIEINSDSWKNLKIKRDSSIQALLSSYFGEIIFNACKYAKPEFDELIFINLDEIILNKKIILRMIFENRYSGEDNIYGTREGIDSIKRELEILNESQDEEENLQLYKEKGVYRLTLCLKKDLLVFESILTDELIKNSFKRKKSEK